MPKQSIDSEIQNTIRQMLDGGRSNRSIADTLGVGVMTVFRYRKRFGMPGLNKKNMPSDETKDIIKSMLERGHTNLEIGRAVGMRAASISRYREMYGTPGKRRGPMGGRSERIDIDESAVRSRLDNGDTIAMVAKDFGVSRTTISRIKHGKRDNRKHE